MKYLERLSISLDRFVSAFGRLASWAAIALVFVIIFDVVSRAQQISIISSTKLQELEWHLHGSLFLLCLGFAYLKDTHVRIELIRENLRPRTRIWIELIGNVFFLIPFAVIAIYWGFQFAEMAFDLGESSAQSGLSNRWIIKGMIPLGSFLLLLAGVSVTLKCLLYLFGPVETHGHATYLAETHHADLSEAAGTLND